MKKGTKILALTILGLVLTSFLVGSISAAQGLTELTKSAIDGTVSIIKPYLQWILGETDSGTIFAAKLLIIIVLISFIMAILPKAMPSLFREGSTLLWVISIAVSLLGVRFLNSAMIYTIILPNETFAVALASLVPFLLYFYIVEFGAIFLTGFARRTAWIFFAVIFLGLYTLRASDLGQVSYIYPLTALIAFVMALLDGTIQRLRNRMRLEREKENLIGVKRKKYYNMLADIQTAYDRLGNAYPGHTYAMGIAGASTASQSGTDAYSRDYEVVFREIKAVK